MAYMNQEKKSLIAKHLTPILKKYNVKGTLSVRHYSEIILKISSGDIDFGGNHPNVNTYWLDKFFDGIALEFLTEAVNALKSAGYYNNSDAMRDYFDIAYYVDIQIGTFNKPYKLTTK